MADIRAVPRVVVQRGLFPWAVLQLSFLRHRYEGGAVEIAAPVEWRELPQNERVDPTHTLDTDGAQQLMDALWEAGIRPTREVGTTGQLAATQAHLHDMQRLVFEGMPARGPHARVVLRRDDDPETMR